MRDDCVLEECVSLPAELFIPEEVPEQQVRADSRLEGSEGQNMGTELGVKTKPRSLGAVCQCHLELFLP